MRIWSLARTLVVLCLWTLGSAYAQGVPRAYAVISEAARDVRVVQYQPSIGSNLPGNRVQRIDVPDGALDKVFLFAAQKQLKKASPDADIWLLAPAASDFFSPSQFADDAILTIPDDLRAALRERKSTHLLLFSRHRADADLRFLNRRDGTGQLEGLGYYVDTSTPVKRVDLGQSSIGFLASYTHFRATLIEVASARVIKTISTTANLINSVAGTAADNTHPWTALSSAEKMSQLRDLTQREVDRIVPELLSAKP